MYRKEAGLVGEGQSGRQLVIWVLFHVSFATRSDGGVDSVAFQCACQARSRAFLVLIVIIT